MTYWPGSEPIPRMVGTYTYPYGYGGYQSTAPTSGGWFSADGATYHALFLPASCVARRLWWANGATVSASYNVDCGIYADAGYKPGAKLISTGTTAQGTASQVQFVDVTDTVVPAGLIWIGMSCSSTSATFFRRVPTAPYAFTFVQASACPLPSTATPAQGTSNWVMCGFTTTASP